jgi:hypothetical protein
MGIGGLNWMGEVKIFGESLNWGVHLLINSNKT